MAETIASMYSDPIILEQAQILKRIMSCVDVELEDGRHVQPPRGIGLGYYENLKALGVWCLIDDYNPISAFGDQVITERGAGFMTPFTASTQQLVDHGFLISKFAKEELRRSGQGLIWMGHLMTSNSCVQAREVWTDISGAFNKEQHWERIDAINGIALPDEYSHIWPHVAFVYERAFGWELFPGQAFGHPDNLGVNRLANPQEGWLKDWKVAMLQRPGMEYKGSVLYSTPHGIPPKAGASRKFSIHRKSVWKKSRPFETAIRDYVNPKIIMNRKYRPTMTALARATPMWADVRSFLLYGMTSGKIVTGLTGDDLRVAPFRQRYARDVFHARATGGYEIRTVNYGIRGPDEDLEILAREAEAGLELTKGCFVPRNDLFHDVGYRHAWVDRPEVESRLPPPMKNPYFELLLKRSIEETQETARAGSQEPVPVDNTLTEVEEVEDQSIYLDMVEQFLPELQGEGEAEDEDPELDTAYWASLVEAQCAEESSDVIDPESGWNL
jgi:hypothetical protein